MGGSVHSSDAFSVLCTAAEAAWWNLPHFRIISAPALPCPALPCPAELSKIPTVLFGTINGVIGVVASLPQAQFQLLEALQV